MIILHTKDISKDYLSELSQKYIKDRFTKARLFLVIYLIIIIVSSTFVAINIIPNETANIILLIVAFVSLMLLYDSFKEILELSKASKKDCIYTKISGTLKKPNDKKIEFFINDTKLKAKKEFDTNELSKYLDTKVTGYFIGSNIFLLEINS